MLASEVEMTPWCNEHDLPMRTTRTADDRIVCWFIWWVEAQYRIAQVAVDADLPLLPLEEALPHIKPCVPSMRVVLAQGTAVVEKGS